MKAGRKLVTDRGLSRQQAWKTAAFTVGLIPDLVLRSLVDSDRQYIVSQITELASDAAAPACRAGETPTVALSLLEQGRGVQGAF